MPPQFNDYRVERKWNPYRDEAQFVVYGFGKYESTSVLAGQTRKVYLASFDDEDEANEEAERLLRLHGPILFSDRIAGSQMEPADDSLAALSGLPESEPEWFDPMDAGERWNDDY